jgi:hypothetical protein
MTVTRKNYVVQSNNYRQPLVMNPPLGQRTENARYAIWHFAELISIDVAQDVSWSKVDGRSYVWSWRTIQCYAVCQPRTDDGQHFGNYEGERTEAGIVVHIDNKDPRNVAFFASYSDIMPNGLYLGGVDDVVGQAQLRVPTIVNFRGQKWKPVSTMALDKAGNEDGDLFNGAFRSECILWRDDNQEMQAGIGAGVTDL